MTGTTMPPAYEAHTKQLGWKVAMGILLVLQPVAIGIMWRTYDAIQSAREDIVRLSTRIDVEVRPTLDRHERAIDRLEMRLPATAIPPVAKKD